MKGGFKVPEGLTEFDVRDYDTHRPMNDEDAEGVLEANIEALNILQQKLYGAARNGLVIVFQAMDAAGKDGTIRKVFSGMNPQGFLVSSFKKPSSRELAHDYLWRVSRQLPSRGRIGVFNRSHYEEVLVTRVHPEYILGQSIPGIERLDQIDRAFWRRRYRHIREWERYLHETGYKMIKFFLHVSKEEQKSRFLKRMKKPEKHWKFSLGDLHERQHWDAYMEAYSDAIRETSTADSPWFIIPADDKDYMRACVSDVVRATMERMDLSYPEATAKQIKDIEEAHRILDAESKQQE